ncbi:MAG: hypothetical protein Q9P01_12610 [Anaerolineae bacterium]|nr:hypothetical protein [Anaerolineae bacterium]
MTIIAKYLYNIREQTSYLGKGRPAFYASMGCLMINLLFRYNEGVNLIK